MCMKKNDHTSTSDYIYVYSLRQIKQYIAIEIDDVDYPYIIRQVTVKWSPDHEKRNMQGNAARNLAKN